MVLALPNRKPFKTEKKCRKNFALFIVLEPSACLAERRHAKASNRIGRFVPLCKANGDYEDLQCRGSVCSCVNKYGVILHNTGRPIGGNQTCPTTGTFIKKMVLKYLCFIFLHKHRLKLWNIYSMIYPSIRYSLVHLTIT